VNKLWITGLCIHCGQAVDNLIVDNSVYTLWITPAVNCLKQKDFFFSVLPYIKQRVSTDIRKNDEVCVVSVAAHISYYVKLSRGAKPQYNQ